MKMLLRTAFLPLLALLAAHSPVQATWYSENIENGADIIMMDRLPIPATSFTGNSGFIESLSNEKVAPR